MEIKSNIPKLFGKPIASFLEDLAKANFVRIDAYS